MLNYQRVSMISIIGGFMTDWLVSPYHFSPRYPWLIGGGQPTPLKNDGVRQWLQDDNPYMKWKIIQLCLKPPTRYIYIYPLEICYIAIENGHRNSGFTHWKWWFSIENDDWLVKSWIDWWNHVKSNVFSAWIASWHPCFTNINICQPPDTTATSSDMCCSSKRWKYFLGESSIKSIYKIN